MVFSLADECLTKRMRVPSLSWKFRTCGACTNYMKKRPYLAISLASTVSCVSFQDDLLPVSLSVFFRVRSEETECFG